MRDSLHHVSRSVYEICARYLTTKRRPDDIIVREVERVALASHGIVWIQSIKRLVLASVNGACYVHAYVNREYLSGHDYACGFRAPRMCSPEHCAW